MLRKKYKPDKEFDILIQLTGEMDGSIYEIDKIVFDDKLFHLIELDLSKRYPNTTKTGRNSTRRRSHLTNASFEALTWFEL